MLQGPKYPICVQIDPTSPEGNSLSVVGKVRRTLRALGVPRTEIQRFQDDALSGDREHLIAVCREWVDLQLDEV